MDDNFQQLLNKYKNKGILIDTNILLLWVVGTVNKKRITKFKRTQQFVPEDFDLLLRIISNFSKVITIPQILTEVNSLTNQLGEPERSYALMIIKEAINQFIEIYSPSQEIAKHSEFSRFGLTDCGISLTASNQYLVLTDDLKLAYHLNNQQIDTINFNHLRIYNWNYSSPN